MSNYYSFRFNNFQHMSRDNQEISRNKLRSKDEQVMTFDD